MKRCLICKKYLNKLQQKYCSVFCKSKSMLGKKHSKKHKENISKATKGILKPMSKIHKKHWRKSVDKTIKERHINLLQTFIPIWNSIPLEQWGWLAGFWEGEGYITHRKLKNNPSDNRMCIVQKDKSVLLYIKKILKTGHLYPHGVCWSYRINKNMLSFLFVYKILPFIKSKKRINQLKKYILAYKKFIKYLKSNKIKE